MPRKDFSIRVIDPHVPADPQPKLDKIMGYGSITCFVAPTSAGKTNLIANLLNRKQFYRKKFGHICVMSSTIDADDTWKAVKQVDEVYDSYNDLAVQHLYDSQIACIKQHGRAETHNVLLILDDLIAEIPKSSSAIASLSTKVRHAKITVWITSQKFTRIPVLLNQTRFWVLFRAAARNRLEHDAIVSEVGNSLPEEEFDSLWKACGSEPWNFLVVSVRSPLPRMFRKEFLKYLIPAEAAE